MMITKRNINSHETYACEVRDVKRVFGKEVDVWIEFGYTRYFKFSYWDNVRPTIPHGIFRTANYQF